MSLTTSSGSWAALEGADVMPKPRSLSQAALCPVCGRRRLLSWNHPTSSLPESGFFLGVVGRGTEKVRREDKKQVWAIKLCLNCCHVCSLSLTTASSSWVSCKPEQGRSGWLPLGLLFPLDLITSVGYKRRAYKSTKKVNMQREAAPALGKCCPLRDRCCGEQDSAGCGHWRALGGPTGGSTAPERCTGSIPAARVNKLGQDPAPGLAGRWRGKPFAVRTFL